MILALAASACSHGSPALSSAYPRGAAPLDGEMAAVECVPFARALSGLQLYGNAADWWWKADGLYDRSSTPAVGSVLVLRRSSRLAQGHVGVVTAIEGDREIRVTQANWVHHRVFADMPVIDVSPANDWTLVRVWWPPTGQMGATVYPAYGFILPDQPRSRDSLAVATGSAIRMAGEAY
ncbi:MAG: CHAP domain-containing protein [Rhodospirillales bacterium]